MSDSLNSDLVESFQGSSLKDLVTEFDRFPRLLPCSSSLGDLVTELNRLNRLYRVMEPVTVEQFRDILGEGCEGEIDPSYERFHHLVDDSDFNVNLGNDFLSLCRSLCHSLLST